MFSHFPLHFLSSSLPRFLRRWMLTIISLAWPLLVRVAALVVGRRAFARGFLRAGALAIRRGAFVIGRAWRFVIGRARRSVIGRGLARALVIGRARFVMGRRAWGFARRLVRALVRRTRGAFVMRRGGRFVLGGRRRVGALVFAALTWGRGTKMILFKIDWTHRD